MLAAIFLITFVLVIAFEFRNAEKRWNETNRDSEEEK